LGRWYRSWSSGEHQWSGNYLTAESRAEPGIEKPAVEAPFQAVFKAIEAGVEEPAIEAVLEAILEAVEAAVEAAVEDSPRPWAEGGAEDPAVEAGSESAAEARVHSVMKTAAGALGVKLARRPQHYQEGQGPHTEEQATSKHDRPPLV
jgi:hypothetical protein